MRRLFQKGAELCCQEGLLDGDTRQKYNMSGMMIYINKELTFLD